MEILGLTQLGWNYVKENRRAVGVVVAAALGLSLIGLIFRKLNQPDVLPFDRWSVKLGLTSRSSLTMDEFREKEKLLDRYSPEELASRTYQYIEGLPRDHILSSTRHILPSYQESSFLFLEDQRALAIQTWIPGLQQLTAFLGWNTMNLSDNVLQAIQASPRLFFTILFNVSTPFLAQKFWEQVNDFLPTSVQDAGKAYLEHKGKIALAGLVLIGFLFYRMQRERGVLTNLTENWGSLRVPHRGLDFIPSYQRGIHDVLFAIGNSAPGQTGSNILWYYRMAAHSTFDGEMGPVLAEMTATGRVFNSERTPSEHPFLQGLKIFELDLKAFLTEYRDRNAVHRGWSETMKYVAREGNVLVVLRNIDVILEQMRGRPSDGERSRESRKDAIDTGEKILFDLLFLSLSQGKLRCLIELDEREKNQLEKDPHLFRLFSAIKAPDITPAELEELCIRLYTAPFPYSIAPEDMRYLFSYMKPSLATLPLPPLDTLRAIQGNLRTTALRAKRIPMNAEMKKAESRLQQAQRIKGELLLKLWEQRRAGNDSFPTLQALYVLESSLLPHYRHACQWIDSKQELVRTVQKHFNRFFGPCTEEEEQKLLRLPQILSEKIKGQNGAMQAIFEAIYLWRKVPPVDGKPLVLFFAGPPGVGKTETATYLAHLLNFIYGIEETPVKTDELNAKRINLNRKRQGGFAGWGAIKFEIMAHILHAPTGVVILEEWDKMAEDEKSCLLELLEGTPSYLQDPFTWSSQNGPYVEKRCAMFIITANIGAGDVQTVKKGIVDASTQSGEAFISRIDAVIPFQNIAQPAASALQQDYVVMYKNLGILPKGQTDIAAPDRSLDGRDLQRSVRTAIFQKVRKN